MKYDKSSIAHRLKIIAGQVDGLAKMIGEGKYCIDILTQSLAIQRALKKVDEKILKNHIDTCVVDQIKKGQREKPVEELIRIYSLSVKD